MESCLGRESVRQCEGTDTKVQQTSKTMANKIYFVSTNSGLVIGRWGHVITYMIVVQQELLNATTFLVHRTPTNAAVTKK
ncbi:hypothetical protein ACROYT_G010991 [Oculina patagonica]